MENKYKYKNLTKEDIEEALKEIIYGQESKNKPKFEVWAFGYEDENGNIRCGFLEEFDKAMKESIKKDERNTHDRS